MLRLNKMFQKIKLIDTHLNFMRVLFNSLHIKLGWAAVGLAFYYLITISNAIIDGVAMLFLISLFTGKIGVITEGSQANHIVNYFTNLLGPNINWIFFLTILFLMNLVFKIGLAVFDGYIVALTRKKLQSRLYENYLNADWVLSRNYSVGDMVGVVTQEALVVSKYIHSVIHSIYFLFAAFTIMALGFLANAPIFLLLVLVASPIIFSLKGIFRVQSRLSKEGASLRNIFSSIITDRFNGLMQIHVEKNQSYHYEIGIKAQKRLTEIDISIGLCQALIGSFSLMLPFLLLLILSVAIYFFNFSEELNYGLYAGLGALGIKVTSQLNGFISALGNLSRLSGSLTPVVNALEIKRVKNLECLTKKINSIHLRGISYEVAGRKVINYLDLDVVSGSPLVISGKSGGGKTTLVNIISGLLLPNYGSISFITDDGASYPSDKYYPSIGFLTQDIYLFDDTLRQTLSPLGFHSDDELWSVLNLVQASDFVRDLGGLGTKFGEGGRRLSGGQRRRIGLARVLLQRSQILIFDEVTSGLDEENVKILLNVIENISKSNIVILITHDPVFLPNQTNLIL